MVTFRFVNNYVHNNVCCWVFCCVVWIHLCNCLYCIRGPYTLTLLMLGEMESILEVLVSSSHICHWRWYFSTRWLEMYLKRYYLLSLSMTLNCIVALISICRNFSPNLRQRRLLILPFCYIYSTVLRICIQISKKLWIPLRIRYEIFSLLIFGLQFCICLF